MGSAAYLDDATSQKPFCFWGDRDLCFYLLSPDSTSTIGLECGFLVVSLIYFPSPLFLKLQLILRIELISERSELDLIT